MSKRIIVIEDDEDILSIMQYILADAGYAVTCFTGRGSLGEIKAHMPSLILLDNKLTGGHGSTLCAQLKADPVTQQIPVILISALGNLEKIARDCNADDFLPKPFGLEDLLEIVKLHIAPSHSLA